MTQNFSACKTLISANNNNGAYIFTDCSLNLIKDVKERKQSDNQKVTIEIPVSDIDIEGLLAISVTEEKKGLCQNLLATLSIKKITELFPELEQEIITSTTEKLGYLNLSLLNYDRIIASIINYYATPSYYDEKYSLLSFYLFTKLALKLKSLKNIDIYINFYITKGIPFILQRAVNDYINDSLPFSGRIYTVFSDLITYRKSNGTIIEDYYTASICSVKSIDTLPKPYKY